MFRWMNRGRAGRGRAWLGWLGWCGAALMPQLARVPRPAPARAVPQRACLEALPAPAAGGGQGAHQAAEAQPRQGAARHAGAAGAAVQGRRAEGGGWGAGWGWVVVGVGGGWLARQAPLGARLRPSLGRRHGESRACLGFGPGMGWPAAGLRAMRCLASSSVLSRVLCTLSHRLHMAPCRHRPSARARFPACPAGDCAACACLLPALRLPAAQPQGV